MKVEQHEGFGVRAVNFRVGVEIGDMDHRKLWNVLLQFFQIEFTDEHRPRKQRGRGAFTDDADGQAMLFIRPGVTVFNENILALKISAEPVLEGLELLSRQGLIDPAPRDLVFTGRLANEEFVRRQTPDMLSGPQNDRAEVAQRTFIAANDFLIQCRRG